MKEKIWVACLPKADGDCASEIVLHDEGLVHQALHGKWRVFEYEYTGEIMEVGDEARHRS